MNAILPFSRSMCLWKSLIQIQWERLISIHSGKSFYVAISVLKLANLYALTVYSIDVNRVHIPKALQTSLRLNRHHTKNSLLLQSVAFFIAIVNLIYVLLLSSALEFYDNANLVIPLGTVISIMAFCEVILRIRPFPWLRELSTTRHIFLDSLAIISALISLLGIIAHAFDRTTGLQALLLGRALDMIRLLRFSSIFRSMIDRTGDVLPALAGPIALVISSLHIYTYIGMAIWEGAVTIGVEESILPLYGKI